MEAIIETITLGAVVGHFVAFIYKWGWVNKAVENLEKIADRHDKHGERIIALETRAEVWTGGDLNKRSPVALTEQGTEFLKKSGAEEYIERNKESLLKQFEGIDEPFDIQEKSLKVAGQELRKDKKIKAFLYQEGEKNMNRITDVTGIALRDVVLKHKGIEVAKG